MTCYFRAIPQFDHARPPAALPIAGGWCWFDHAERIERGGARQLIPAHEVPPEVAQLISAPRPAIAGLAMDRPRLMGILNVTPDSFSDGGLYDGAPAAISHARDMIKNGADIIDIGGESTRPGADMVSAEQEIERTVPVIRSVRRDGAHPVSIDTRKGKVASAALAAGASLVNDVSALSFDAKLSGIIANAGVPVCLMHARGDPMTMQDRPQYDDVLLDVYDHLQDRIETALASGIARAKIVIDPGIGFGKTVAHNLALLRGLSLFHSLGCPIMLGASRKRFIGTLGDAPEAGARMPGSIAVALAGIAQGVQISRVHDIAQTRQALVLWAAATGMRQQ